MASTQRTLRSGMQQVEAALRAQLCGGCRDVALAWIPARPLDDPAAASRAEPCDYKIAVRSADVSVLALLTRQQLEGCADGVAHPDVIALIRECLQALRER